MADNLLTTFPPSHNDHSIATSDDESIDLTPACVRRGRRPKFTAEDDMIIAREVAATKANIASFGDKREHFAAAAERAKAKHTMKHAVTSKSILWPIACCGFQLCRQCGLAVVHKTSFARVDPRTIYTAGTQENNRTQELQ
jgi:hypothetical protein